MEEHDEPLKVGEYAIVIKPHDNSNHMRHHVHSYPIGSRVLITKHDPVLYNSYYCHLEPYADSFLSYDELKREEFLDIVKQILKEHGEQ